MVGSHDKSYSAVMDEIVRNTVVDGTVWQDQLGRKYSNSTNQLILGNAQYEFNKHRLAYNILLLHTNNQYVGEYTGTNGENIKMTLTDI